MWTGAVALAWMCWTGAAAPPLHAQISEEFVRAYLWPATAAEFADAREALSTAPDLVGVTRAQMHDLEEMVRRGRFGAAPSPAPVLDPVTALMAVAPGHRTIPVLVRVPTDYSPRRQWPILLAMHGGPPGSPEGATRSAERMIQVWAEAAEAAGWIVAAPAMVSTVSREGRTADRLPYEIFHPEEAKAVVDEVRRRFNVDPDRVVSTGISLGSNFSIAFAAAHPDWFSAIVPVSTEGDSRELLLRNLQPVPVYVLEGTQDQNIRGVGGPRALDAILSSFGYDLTYREFGDRAHEGFQEHYPDVLRWLASRPRDRARSEVLRVPHSGIVPVSRRVHWIESGTRQGLVRARVTGPTQIDITARWTDRITVFLNDDLVNLDRPLTIRVNGETVFTGQVDRSMKTALEEVERLGDERRIYAARVELSVPNEAAAARSGVALWEELTPMHPQGQLSFWEMYAVRALEERFPTVGFDGVEIDLRTTETGLAPEQVGIQVTSVDPESTVGRAGLVSGDVLVRVDGEPFFSGRGGVPGLHAWMMRDLRETPSDWVFEVLRGGRPVEISASIGLGPYR